MITASSVMKNKITWIFFLFKKLQNTTNIDLLRLQAGNQNFGLAAWHSCRIAIFVFLTLPQGPSAQDLPAYRVRFTTRAGQRIS